MYQTVALSIEGFPHELAMQTFALATMDFTTPPGTTTWRVETMGQVQSVFGSIFEDGPDFCSGASKAFKTASEPVIRVIGTIMPGAVISHVEQSRGVAKLFINLNYILSDEDGELHPPKDINRLELLLSPEEVSELRSQVATDAYFMGEKGLPLSASWWRQIANEEQALMAEALLHNLSTAPAVRHRRRASGGGARTTTRSSRSCRSRGGGSWSGGLATIRVGRRGASRGRWGRRWRRGSRNGS